MRKVKMFRNIATPKKALLDLTDNIKTILRKFGTKKVIETNLVPKTFSFEFDFRTDRRTCSKSLDRLWKIIIRSVIKQIPYIESTSKNFMSVDSNKRLVLNVVTQRIKSTITPSAFNDGYQIKHWDSLSKYFHRLNTIFVKHRLPLKINFNYEVLFAEESLEQYNLLSEIEQHLPENYPECYMEFSTCLFLGTWYNRNCPIEMDSPSLENSEKYYQEWLNTKLEVEGINFYNPDSWVFIPARDYAGAEKSIGRSRLINAGFEKIFFYLPQIIKVIKTLSRKASYVPEAFSIGCTETTES